MAVTYRYAVNNMPHQWTLDIDEGKGTTTAYGRTFTPEGDDADAVIAALVAEFEDIGWFVSQPFSKG